MNEQVRFNIGCYEKVKNYLDSHKDLHSKASFGGEGRVYLTNSRKCVSGFILYKCEDEGVLSIINHHPSFDKIKSDLGKLIKENG